MKRRFVLLALIGAAISSHAAPEWVRGEIVKVVPEKAQLTLKAEAIKSVGMDAMTMPYKAANGAMLKGFKPGDAVRFTVTAKGDELIVQTIEHLK